MIFTEEQTKISGLEVKIPYKVASLLEEDFILYIVKDLYVLITELRGIHDLSRIKEIIEDEKGWLGFIEKYKDKIKLKQ